jgi:RNA polymerase sigma-70 factor, ECF subfamily
MAGGLDFDEFYDASFRRVVGQVYAMAGSLSEAEDSVQEAFARAWQNWNRVGQYADAEAWVRSVAFRISVSSWRKTVNRITAHRRRAAVADDPPGLSPDRLAVVTALRQIDPDLRQVIVLHHLLDRSVEEISRETGVPSGTVKARLVRGRKALAPHLSESAGSAWAETGDQGAAAKGAGRYPGRGRRAVAGQHASSQTAKERAVAGQDASSQTAKEAAVTETGWCADSGCGGVADEGSSGQAARETGRYADSGCIAGMDLDPASQAAMSAAAQEGGRYGDGGRSSAIDQHASDQHASGRAGKAAAGTERGRYAGRGRGAAVKKNASSQKEGEHHA